MTREQRVRAYANHLGLMVRGSNDSALRLIERYGKKRVIGSYRSIDAVERGIKRHGERMLAELDHQGY